MRSPTPTTRSRPRPGRRAPDRPGRPGPSRPTSSRPSTTPGWPRRPRCRRTGRSPPASPSAAASRARFGRETGGRWRSSRTARGSASRAHGDTGPRGRVLRWVTGPRDVRRAGSRAACRGATTSAGSTGPSNASSTSSPSGGSRARRSWRSAAGSERSRSSCCVAERPAPRTSRSGELRGRGGDLLRESDLAGRSRRRSTTSPPSPDEVEPADVVLLHRVVCCYPDYEKLWCRRRPCPADAGVLPSAAQLVHRWSWRWSTRLRRLQATAQGVRTPAFRDGRRGQGSGPDARVPPRRLRMGRGRLRPLTIRCDGRASATASLVEARAADRALPDNRCARADNDRPEFTRRW